MEHRPVYEAWAWIMHTSPGRRVCMERGLQGEWLLPITEDKDVRICSRYIDTDESLDPVERDAVAVANSDYRCIVHVMDIGQAKALGPSANQDDVSMEQHGEWILLDTLQEAEVDPLSWILIHRLFS